jgi:hypothetical protein
VNEQRIFSAILGDRSLVVTAGLALVVVAFALAHLHRARWYGSLRWPRRGKLHLAALVCGLGGLLVVRLVAARTLVP